MLNLKEWLADDLGAARMNRTALFLWLYRSMEAYKQSGFVFVEVRRGLSDRPLHPFGSMLNLKEWLDDGLRTVRLIRTAFSV